jgi:hypothetical protein
MNVRSLRRTGFWRFLIGLSALASWPGAAATSGDSAEVAPLNSHMKRSGGGWECDRGYRRVGLVCEGVEVPPNASLDSFGLRWECDRGYRKADGVCAKLEVPPHAFLGSRGSEWECDRGYRRVDQSCAAIAVPENSR